MKRGFAMAVSPMMTSFVALIDLILFVVGWVLASVVLASVALEVVG